MDVVIVESPAKAKTINKYLGKNYEVYASYGHIRDLPSKDGSVDPDDDFAMIWDVDVKSAKRMADIAKAVKGADRVILATDPDREGEAISWHVLEVLKNKKVLKDVEVSRVTFNAITKSAVTEAMAKPRQIDGALVDAYLARRALDYLVGFTLSPVLWRKLPGARSAGRVQSVTLRIICERELEIEKFVRQEYWSLVASLKTVDGSAFTARLVGADGTKLGRLDIKTEAEARAFQAALDKGAYSVTKVEAKLARRNPYPPFTTSTMQQEASRKLGFPPNRTMQLAQRLYEGVDVGGETIGLITYMRTDGVDMAPEAVHGTRRVIHKEFGERYVPKEPRQYKVKAKNAQEAHEAVRPTEMARLPKLVSKSIEPDLAKLYELIWTRTVASQMESADLERTTVDILAYVRGPQARPARQRPGGQVRRLFAALSGRPRRRGRRGWRSPPVDERRRPARQGDDRGLAAFDRAAAALHRGDDHQADGGTRHRASVHLRCDDPDVEGPGICPPRQEAPRAGGQGSARHRLSRKFLRPLRRLRLHRRPRREARPDLEPRDRLETGSPGLLGGLFRSRRRDQGPADDRGSRQSQRSPRPAYLPGARGRRRPAPMPDLRDRPVVAEARQVRRLHRLLELSRLQVHAPDRPGRWRRGGSRRSEGPWPRSRERVRSHVARRPLRPLHPARRAGGRREAQALVAAERPRARRRHAGSGACPALPAARGGEASRDERADLRRARSLWTLRPARQDLCEYRQGRRRPDDRRQPGDRSHRRQGKRTDGTAVRWQRGRALESFGRSSVGRRHCAEGRTLRALCQSRQDQRDAAEGRRSDDVHARRGHRADRSEGERRWRGWWRGAGPAPRRASRWRRDHRATRPVRALRQSRQDQRDAEARHVAGDAQPGRGDPPRRGQGGRRDRAPQGRGKSIEGRVPRQESACEESAGEEGGRKEGSGESEKESMTKRDRADVARPAATPLPSRDEIIAFVAREQAAASERAPAKIGKREIARAFQIKGADKIGLKRVLKELEAEGAVERRRKSLTKPGVLQTTVLAEIFTRDRDGDLLAKPVDWDETQGRAPTIVLHLPRKPRPGKAGTGSPAPGLGDRALVRTELIRDPAGGGAAYTGRIVKILAKARSQVLGIYRAGPGPGGQVWPVDKKAANKGALAVRAGDEGLAQDGDLVAVDILKGGRFGLPNAKVTDRIGSFASEKAVSLIAIYTHKIPNVFHPETIAEAESVRPAKLAGREDWRLLPLVTIDPPDAKDHDDAVYAESDPDAANPGGFVLTVAIADVAAYVRPRSALDREALERGNSVYFPDRVVPMLPERISNDLCSLRANEDRPALAMRMVIDAQGRKRRHTLHRIMMRSKAKLSYVQAQAAIDGAPDTTTWPLLAPILEPLWTAYAALKLAKAARQPLDLDLPERKILLDADGKVERVVVPERLDAHRLIEEFMILANVAAAELLEERRQVLVYRAHGEPSVEKLHNLGEFLQTIGIKLAKGQVVTPAQFNGILAKVRGTEHEQIVNDVVLRSQAQAEYTADNYGHFGLHLRRYAHFTSPIRRYADLIVHRALIRAERLGDDGLPNMERDELAEIAVRISAAERRAMAAERETIDRLIATHLVDKVGATFEGRIAGVTRAGLFVKLADTGADGFIPAATIGDEFFRYEDAMHALIGSRSGVTLRLGDPITVKLVEAAPFAGALRFERVDHGGSRPRKATGGAARVIQRGARDVRSSGKNRRKV